LGNTSNGREFSGLRSTFVSFCFVINCDTVNLGDKYPVFGRKQWVLGGKHQYNSIQALKNPLVSFLWFIRFHKFSVLHTEELSKIICRSFKIVP